ncbi:lysylphosphatidylglycerol synthase transmembrane domain-containing protein [Ekhidna sp.]|uniref:lysylphosphatidylglycerol synthase transmembrane domain-containing protein n=1 Tax=Ekhidna sp. TaxID=2608089 RepID=UPI0032984D04
MSKNLLAFLKILISVGLAGLLLYLVFRNVDWIEFWNRAKSVDYSWVIASIFLSVVAYVARAYRWNILLEPLGYNLNTSRTTLAVLIGYLANLALPRLGEITRCGVLKRNDNVSMPSAFGSVVTERIVDVFTLFLFIIISLFLESQRLYEFLHDAYKDLNIPYPILAGLVLTMIIGVVTLIIVVRKKDGLKGRFAILLKGFIDGLLSLKDIKRPIGFIVSTLVLWLVYYLMSYIIIFSLPETSHLGPGVGFMLLITGGIALSIPVQSGFGTYHGMIAGMLLLYAVDENTGIFLATLLHTSQIVSVALFGSIALIISLIIRRKKSKEDKLAE